MPFFDVHAHLTHHKLMPHLPEILERAKAANVTSIICNGLNLNDNEHNLELAKNHSAIKPALGFYPVDVVLTEMQALGIEYHRDPGEFTHSVEETLAWLKQHAPQAFAIGEIGLDGYWVPESLWQKQENVFCELLQIAKDNDKAVIIHTRKREKRAYEILLEMQMPRINWHCFGGKTKLAGQAADQGHYFSIPANARRSETFTRMIQKLPRDRLLLETDCPYLGPDKDQDNEPANVARTAQYFAELWNTDIGEIEQQLTKNFERLFLTSP
jgi:TatD DNase family protein